MCLDTVFETHNYPGKDVGERRGYKVFRWNPNTGHLQYPLFCEYVRRPFGIWQKSYTRRSLNYYNNSESYPAGIHVFLRRKDARSWARYESHRIVVEVAWRGLLAKGEQNKGPTVVASEVLPMFPICFGNGET